MSLASLKPPDSDRRARVPHDPGAERSLVGAMLLSTAAIEAAVELVDAADFHVPSLGHVFHAVTALWRAGAPVDVVTVADRLTRAGVLDQVGGTAELIGLQAATPSTSSASGYAAIVADHARRRRLLAAGAEVMELAVTAGDVTDAANRAEVLVRQAATSPGGRRRRWTTQELLEADRRFAWRVRGLLVDPTFGMVGGERKTLKSYVTTALSLAVASGRPLFGQFTVDQPAPVVSYVGEGGRVPHTRRLERLADAMGVDLGSTPLFTSFDTAPIPTPAFQSALAADLRELEPGLVTLDPLYAFHGSATSGASLYEEGELLNSLSRPCGDAGASLLVVTHFNKSGVGRGLDRLTMAGAQEWSDTWLLVTQRDEPNVEAGEFRLLLEIGSRQWGGAQWELDLNVGRFDPDRGEFDGDISWDVRRHDPRAAAAEALDEVDGRVLAAVLERPGQLTKEELAKAAGGKLLSARDAVRRLEERGHIGVEMVTRKTSDGRVRKAWAYVARPVALDVEASDGERGPRA